MKSRFLLHVDKGAILDTIRDYEVIPIVLAGKPGEDLFKSDSKVE